MIDILNYLIFLILLVFLFLSLLALDHPLTPPMLPLSIIIELVGHDMLLQSFGDDELLLDVASLGHASTTGA